MVDPIKTSGCRKNLDLALFSLSTDSKLRALPS